MDDEVKDEGSIIIHRTKIFLRHIKLYLKMYNFNYSSRLSLKCLSLNICFDRTILMSFEPL